MGRADEHRDLVLHTYNEVWGGKAEAFLSLDYVDHNPRMRMSPDLDGFKRMVEMLRAAFPDFESAVEDMVVEGDKVAVRSVNRGTHTGPLMGIPPTGKRVSWEGMAILRVRDGKIVERWGVIDTLSLLQQLGAAPHRPGP